MMFCAKFGLNWLGGSGEEVVNVFSLCSYYLPLTKGMVLHFNKLNRLHLEMLYVKNDGTWLSDSEVVDMWKNVDGRLDRQIDR